MDENIAPVRRGKGVGIIYPNLLTSTGQTIVIDVKGKVARRQEEGAPNA